MISRTLLEELKTIVKEDYGKDLTPEEVSEIGTTLLNYFDLLTEVEAEAGSLES